MYLARPPISPNKHPQLDQKPTVKLHRGAGNKTTVMVRDPDQVRHPVSKKFLSRFQNQQSSAPAAPVTDTTKGGRYTSGSGRQ